MTTVLMCSVTNYGSHPYVTFLFHKVDCCAGMPVCCLAHNQLCQGVTGTVGYVLDSTLSMPAQ